MERRLTTIVACDLVGYSRIIAADEEGTLERFKALRSDLIAPELKASRARLIKTMGDGLLVEFPSPVVAVRTCLTIQKTMVLREADQPDAMKLRFRIGINLGDVVIDGEDILGDGVNIAARLESLAPPGGICISRSVFDQLRGKISQPLTSLGPQAVKNLLEPVEVWRVEVEGVAPPKRSTSAAAKRPSIAVLPFNNMSRDPEQEFLADGIVEDVITELSRFRSLFVIARNSTFSFKGEAIDVREIAKKLGADYVVEGSVRSSADRLRVTAQLISAKNGAHLWAERWDRTVEDLFDVQDELTQAIISNVEPEMGANERMMARKKPTKNLTAWELYQRGYTEYLSSTEEGYKRCFDYLHRAIELDPEFSLPHALLARWYYYMLLTYRYKDKDAYTREGVLHGNTAIQFDEREESGYASLSMVLSVVQREHEALAALKKSEAINPNNTITSLARAIFHNCQKEIDGAGLESAASKCIAQSPRDPNRWAYDIFLATGRLMHNNFDFSHNEVIESFEASASHENSEASAFMLAAICNVKKGRIERAHDLLDQALYMQPGLTAEIYNDHFFDTFNWHVIKEKAAPYIEVLVKLGLPRN